MPSGGKQTKTPDRIYIHTSPHLGLLEATAIKVNAPGEQEYIRADIVDETIETAEDHAYFAGKENMREELLEWVRLAYGKLSMNPFDVQDVFEELIDKLSSM